MDDRPPQAPSPSTLSAWAPQLASTLALAASDIALVIDADGVVRNVAVGTSALIDLPEEWVGKPWAQTVTGETRRKIELLLQEAGEAGYSRRREVNLRTAAGPGIPVAYAAVRLGENGPVLAVGRDLRGVAAIQQRFTDAQQEMERSYWKLRQAEWHYRMLFQVATDAVLVVDALSLAIVEANQAAAQLFGIGAAQLAGQSLAVGLDARSAPAVEALLASTRSSGRPAEMRARLRSNASMLELSATPFRGDGGMLLLVRARAVEPRPATEGGETRLADFVERMNDAVAITDSSGRVSMANPAFLALCELAGDSAVEGARLDQWIGEPGRELGSLLAQARRQGMVSHAVTTLRPARGQPIEVDLSAALLVDADQEWIGFTIHRRAPHAAAALAGVDELVSGIERLTAQLGRVALPELLRQAAGLTERHLIAHTIDRARGDLDMAALLLGVSRTDLDGRLGRLALGGGGLPLPWLN